MYQRGLFFLSLVLYILITIPFVQLEDQYYDVTEFVTSTFLTIINPFPVIRSADQTSFAFRTIKSGEVVIQGTISEKMFISSTFYRGPFVNVITNELLTKHYTTNALTGILLNTANSPPTDVIYTMPEILPTRSIPFPIGYNITRIVANTLETILSTNQQGITITFNHAAIGQEVSQNPINNVPFLSPGIITRTRSATNSFTNGPSTTYQTLIYYTFNFQLPHSLPPEELLPFTKDSGTFPAPNNYIPNFPSLVNNMITNQTPYILPSRPFNSEFFFNNFHEFWSPIKHFYINNLRNWPAGVDNKLISGNFTDHANARITVEVTEIITSAIQTLVFTINGVAQTSTVTGSSKEIHSSTLLPNFYNFNKFNQISTTANIETLHGTTIFGTTTFITHQYVTTQPIHGDVNVQATIAAAPSLVRFERSM